MLTSKILGISSAVLLIICAALAFSLVQKESKIDAQRSKIVMLEDRQDLTLDILTKATGNTKLTVEDIPLQVELLGESLAGANLTLSNQSQAIDKLAEEREIALQEADRQAALRKGVILKSNRLREQLTQDALEPVERERLEEELRRVQDLAFKGGL